MENKFKPIKCTYYILFVTRYKRDFFVDTHLKELVLSGFREVEQSKLIELEEVRFSDYYVFIQCEGVPSKSPNQIVAALKRCGYQAILNAFPTLNSLWSRPFILSTEPLSQGQIEEFLSKIKTRG
ncbi:TPA: transposase [Salmonella enterica subsp. enterica serovar Typhi str. AG3]|nr:transposase [Salmonella enterica subsp. enterica serovar Typhi str. AG3]